MSDSIEKKDYEIYQKVLTDEVLKKLPLTFRHMQKGDKKNPYSIRRQGKSSFHQNDEYVLHGYYKPVSKIILDTTQEKTDDKDQ